MIPFEWLGVYGNGVLLTVVFCGEHRPRCKGCGAPLKSIVCEYCDKKANPNEWRVE